MGIMIRVKPGVGITMAPNDRPTFDEWMARVDSILRRHTGIESGDLPDCPYRDWYESHLRPIRAANRALRRAGAEVE